MERRLAAILAADIVGYSRLMGEDEGQALVHLKACEADVIEPSVWRLNSRHDGVQYDLDRGGNLETTARVARAIPATWQPH